MGGKEPSGNLCGDRSNEVSLFHKKPKISTVSKCYAHLNYILKVGNVRWRDKIYAYLYRKSCDFREKIREIIFPAENPGTALLAYSATLVEFLCGGNITRRNFTEL